MRYRFFLLYVLFNRIFLILIVSNKNSAILDVHPEVNCGPETKILPMILKFIKDAQKNKAFIKDLENAHLNISKVDEATASFINYILKNDDNLVQTRQCCKDPDILYYMSN